LTLHAPEVIELVAKERGLNFCGDMSEVELAKHNRFLDWQLDEKTGCIFQGEVNQENGQKFGRGLNIDP